MSTYQVIARKYRPQTFAEVVGQEAIVQTLKNAIERERIAHAYLFCGTRGTGKTTLARLLAKALNCAARTGCEPCNACPSCKGIAGGHAIDVLEIDGASHRGIEDIRQINETIAFTPAAGKYKIYLIDEVHMLTKEAFNALLKTLEEPPSHAKFFFATTEVHKIPATILSRCQRYNLGRIPAEKIEQALSRIAADLEISVEEGALALLAELSGGSLRDGESLLDQAIAYGENSLTEKTLLELLGLPSRDLFFELDRAVDSEETLEAFRLGEKIYNSGKNIAHFLEELTLHFRTLLLTKQGVVTRGRDENKYAQSATLYDEGQLLHILELLIEAEKGLRFATSQKTALEMLLLQIIRTKQPFSLPQLVEKLMALESRLEPPPSSPAKEEKPPPVQRAKERTTEKKIKPQVSVKGRLDTLLRFAAKELDGTLKLE